MDASAGRGRGRRSPRPALVVLAALGWLAAGCGTATAADGADVDRPAEPDIGSVRYTDVAGELGLDFAHGAFRFGATGDPASMMGGGVCWIDYDDDGWLDLLAVNSWTQGEWGRWREKGLPRSRLYRNDAGRFRDVTDQAGLRLDGRGNGCVAADLDLDGDTDLYVTTDRENVLLWNSGDGTFRADDGTAGVDTYGWHAGAAVADVNGDGWPDLFVTGYVDVNQPVPGTPLGFPNTFRAERDLLFLNEGPGSGEEPRFTEVARAAGIESDGVDYGLGALLTDADGDGDIDLHVANDTQPNRLYVNEPDPSSGIGFRLVDRGREAGVDDANAGMGIALGDYDLDGGDDVAVTNMAEQGHAVFRSGLDRPQPSFDPALDAMGLPELGKGLTGWGVAWVDVDLDTDLDLLMAHGGLPIEDPRRDAQQLQLFENLTAQGRKGRFQDATAAVGLDRSGRHLARGLAAADYDNDGDVDLAVGTIGNDIGLLRNNGAGGHWLVVDPDPATPGTKVTVTLGDGTELHRELRAGSSYLSSEDPRLHLGLGTADTVESVQVDWPDGSEVTVREVPADQVLGVEPG